MIRLATQEDIPALVALGALMHEESIYAPFEYNTEKVSKLIEALIHTSFGIALVAEVDNVLIGGFLGCVQEQYFGSDTVASDYALFVTPSHRASTAAPRMVKKFVEIAKAKGAKQIMLGNSTGVEFERVAQLYEAIGFKRRGYVFEYADV